jgi:hypothetical protein
MQIAYRFEKKITLHISVANDEAVVVALSSKFSATIRHCVIVSSAAGNISSH